MSYETILYEANKESGYIKITLNRPEKRNAISLQMADELKDALTQAKKESWLKALLLTGAGEQAFCSGGDLHDFHGDITEQEVAGMLRKVMVVLYELVRFPIPTISLLNGHSRGGGCELASATDFRLAKKDSTHGFIQGKLGIIPGFGGGALLYRRIDPTNAFYWLSSSQVFESDQLKGWGWIQAIFSSKMEAESFLRPFLDKNVHLMRHFKQQLLSQPSFNEVKAEMEKEMLACASLWVSEEHKNAVDSFLKR